MIKMQRRKNFRFLSLIAIIVHLQLIKCKSFETKGSSVASGINYEYVYVEAGNNNGSKGAILFLHGFPSSSYSWRHQIDYFSKEGYDCLAPDLMGYGKTYSPLETKEYKMKSMAEHLTTLLNQLEIDKVIVVAHDWGTRLASRFALYYPERTLGVTLISGAYGRPALFDLDLAIETSIKAVGYEILGYWKFFEANDAAKIIEDNIDSFIDIIFPNDTTLWKTNFILLGKLRDWLINKNRTNRASYLTDTDYAIIRQYLSEGMQPKLNWYKALIENNDWNDEKDLDPVIKKPFLYLGGTKDPVSIIAAYQEPNPYIQDLEIIPLNTGHWVMEEDPHGVNECIHKWINKTKKD